MPHTEWLVGALIVASIAGVACNGGPADSHSVNGTSAPVRLRLSGSAEEQAAAEARAESLAVPPAGLQFLRMPLSEVPGSAEIEEEIELLQRFHAWQVFNVVTPKFFDGHDREAEGAMGLLAIGVGPPGAVDRATVDAHLLADIPPGESQTSHRNFALSELQVVQSATGTSSWWTSTDGALFVKLFWIGPPALMDNVLASIEAQVLPHGSPLSGTTP